MNSKIAAMTVVLLVALAIGIWYYLASRTLTGYDQSAQVATNAIDSVRVSIFDGNALKADIRFGDLTAYLNVYQKNRPILAGIQDDLKEGKGMGFWLPDARERSVTAIQKFLENEDVVVANCTRAIGAVAPLHTENVDILGKSATERSTAIAILNPNSDAGDFASEGESLSRVSASLLESAARVAAARGRTLPDGMAESMRVGLLNNMERQLNEENRAVATRQKALGIAERVLASHKVALRQILSSQSSIVQVTNSIASEFGPVVSTAAREVQPVRELIAQLEQPIFDVGIAGNLGALLGRGGQSTQISALTLIENVDPSTGTMINTVKDICEGIATAEQEISGILEATQPFLESSRQFHSTLSRQDMLRVIETAPTVGSYYESKRNIFDPVTSRLDEGRNAVNVLNAAASRIRVAGAQNLVYRLTGGAQQLIAVAYGPFESWQSTVTVVSKTSEQITDRERQHVATLEQLKTDNLDAVQDQPVTELDLHETGGENAAQGTTTQTQAEGTGASGEASLSVTAYKECPVALISEEESAGQQYGWWSVWHDRKESNRLTTPHRFEHLRPGTYTLVVYNPSHARSDGIVLRDIAISAGTAKEYSFKEDDFVDWNCLSCPWVYVFDGKEYIRESEILKDVIGRGAQRTDLMPIPARSVLGGVVRLMLSEEKDEVTHIDRISLACGTEAYRPSLVAGNDGRRILSMPLTLRKGDRVYLEFPVPDTIAPGDSLVFQVHGYYDPDPDALRAYGERLRSRR
jgi:hypothetical protein